jgi:hypothetical protein
VTITSIGYDGSITEVQWAKLAAYLGRTPCVADAAAWKVTAVVGPDRTVRVATGDGYASGVLDTSSATVDVQLATIASGTRWDAIVARRDWTPTPGGGTTFTSVAGTSAQALPAGLLVNPGVVADQVLALVQLTAGQSTPTAVVDMRALPKNAVTYPSTFSLPTAAPVGSTADVAGRQYTKDASGWARSEPRVRAGVAAMSFNSSGLGTLVFSPALDFVPATIFVTPRLGAAGILMAHNTGAGMLTATGATIRAWSAASGAPYVGSLSAVQWIVCEA